MKPNWFKVLGFSLIQEALVIVLAKNICQNTVLVIKALHYTAFKAKVLRVEAHDVGVGAVVLLVPCKSTNKPESKTLRN